MPTAVPSVVHNPDVAAQVVTLEQNLAAEDRYAARREPLKQRLLTGASSNVPVPVPFVSQRPLSSSASWPWKRTMFGSTSAPSF